MLFNGVHILYEEQNIKYSINAHGFLLHMSHFLRRAGSDVPETPCY